MVYASGSSLKLGQLAAYELRVCLHVMQQLRPNLSNTEDFVARVHGMHADGYCLLAA